MSPRLKFVAGAFHPAAFSIVPAGNLPSLRATNPATDLELPSLSDDTILTYADPISKPYFLLALCSGLNPARSANAFQSLSKWSINLGTCAITSSLETFFVTAMFFNTFKLIFSLN